MEAEMKEMDEKLGKNAFSEDDNFDKAIPIQIRKERTIEAYKEKMNKDIETIDKNENSKKIVPKTKWRPIYEVIDEDYIKNSHIFPDDFITKCKQCPNEPQNISRDVKNNIKGMAMEQSLFAQVIVFRRKDLKFDAADENKNESTFKFQGRSVGGTMRSIYGGGGGWLKGLGWRCLSREGKKRKNDSPGNEIKLT